MLFKPHYLLVVLTLCCFAALHAFPMGGFAPRRTCRCIRTSSAFISPMRFHKLEILPAGSHCSRIEIIVTKKDKTIVCVNPEARWINKVIALLQRNKASAGVPISTTTDGINTIVEQLQ
ncbi:C-X-C motif chemokine 13 precursor [Salmo salar]|uniref:C-X-C motif chemokine 13 n=1 Tax=Salmo salar TaxID=8030 RepID=B5XB31_SALSA|nr:C-X-C motif chemokine 13 precursor [Salmo salar]ACI68051.1 C-X-C motif chemokine 13 precursor [Salmo salar]|eukprot:NP_001134571.1 C-X-C motif chemokine 13 precursor [Salmo salar]